MPVDMEEQLAAYGSWLERSHATTLRPTPPIVAPGPEGPAQFVGVSSTEHVRRRWRVVSVAAIAVFVVGLIGAAIAIRPTSSPAASSVATDPPGPLYVLPTGTDVTVSDGHAAMLLTETGSPTPQLGSGAAIGRSLDGGFDDLVTVLTFTEFYPSSTDLDTSSADWIAGEYGGFPTWTFSHDFVTSMAQDRGAWWVTVQAGPDRALAVRDVLDHVIVTSTGEISLDATSTREIIEVYSFEESNLEAFEADWTATFAGSQDPKVLVQTLAGPGFISSLGFERIEPTTVNGVKAWRMFSGDGSPSSDSLPADEPLTGVQWQYSPNRTVIVRGQTDADTLQQFAATLEQVTPDQWAAALPGFTSECTLSDDAQLCDELPLEQGD